MKWATRVPTGFAAATYVAICIAAGSALGLGLAGCSDDGGVSDAATDSGSDSKDAIESFDGLNPDTGDPDAGEPDTQSATDSGAESDTDSNDGSESDADSADTDADSAALFIQTSHFTCDDSERVGRIEVEVGDGPSVQGYVANGVVPLLVLDAVLEEEECRLLVPPSLFCEAPCASGFTCGGSGECVAYPANQDVGTLVVQGLTAAVRLNPIPPQKFYYFAGDLPAPGVAAGDSVAMTASDALDDSGDSLRLAARGVEPIVPRQTDVPLTAGSDALVTWEPAAPVDDAVRIFVEVNIANHGGTPARIECLTMDSGTLAIDSTLVEGLLALGYSGFPTVTLRRESRAAAAAWVDGTELGCVEFLVSHHAVLPAAIDGLISCSSTLDCPQGQECQPDLVCQ